MWQNPRILFRLGRVLPNQNCPSDFRPTNIALYSIRRSWISEQDGPTRPLPIFTGDRNNV